MAKIKYTQESFIEKANLVHSNFYDYSKVNYIDIVSKILIICPIHGEFTQKPSNHLFGQGCPECGKIKAKKSKSLTQKQFEEKVYSIHGNKYDLSKSIYENNRTKVDVICGIHGLFKISPENLMKGMHCKKCSCSNLLIDETNYIKRINHLLSDSISIVSGSYSGMNNSIQFDCSIHGTFKKGRAIDVLKSKNICPKCSRQGHGQYNTTRVIRGDFDNEKGLLYLLLVKNEKSIFYKIGVTKIDSSTFRFNKLRNDLSNFEITVIDKIEDLLSECIFMESFLSDKFLDKKTEIGIDFGGKSEIYDSSILKTGEGLTNLLEGYCRRTRQS